MELAHEILDWDDADDDVLRIKDSMDFDKLLEKYENLRDSYRNLSDSIKRQLDRFGERLPFQAEI